MSRWYAGALLTRKCYKKCEIVLDTIEENEKFSFHASDKWESSYIDLAYRFIEAAISIRKTYGEVISLLRYNNASVVTKMLVRTAEQKGMTPADYLNSVLAMISA